MRRLRSHLVALLLVLMSLQLLAADRKELAKRIDEILAQPDVSRGFWGIEIVDLNNGRTVYSHDADKLFTPASNTKLFTTAAVLALIGPDYRFHTTLETTGTLDRYGRVSGDLVLVGRGDPNLSGRTLPYNLRTERKLSPSKVLEDLADQLVAKGVKAIDGDVVADDSYFAFERFGEGWSQDDLVWEWGAPVSAISINDNVLFVTIMPADHPGDKAFVSIVPFAEYYHIDNRIMTTPAGMGPRRIFINREPGSNQLTLWGNIPHDDAGATEALAIDDPADYAARLFKQLVEKRGITVFGRTRTRHTELASLSTFSVTTMAAAGGGGDATYRQAVTTPLVLSSYQSAPLGQDLRVINKVSQNLHAELMLRLLGKEKGAAGTIEGGLEVMRGFLSQAEIRPEEYAFFDGSGLSRQNLVTPHAVVKLLTYASKQTWGQLYMDTLPVGGVDGSLAERFKSAASIGRVKAKTGSLSHVNALSGYLTTMKGDHVVFSVMGNNHALTTKKALDTLDSIVEAVIDDVQKK